MVHFGPDPKYTAPNWWFTFFFSFLFHNARCELFNDWNFIIFIPYYSDLFRWNPLKPIASHTQNLCRHNSIGSRILSSEMNPLWGLYPEWTQFTRLIRLSWVHGISPSKSARQQSIRKPFSTSRRCRWYASSTIFTNELRMRKFVNDLSVGASISLEFIGFGKPSLFHQYLEHAHSL